MPSDYEQQNYNFLQSLKIIPPHTLVSPFIKPKISSSKCNGSLMPEMGKNLPGRCPVQTFPGSGVHPMNDSIQLTLWIPRQVRMLVGPVLPRAMRNGKERLDTRLGFQGMAMRGVATCTSILHSSEESLLGEIEVHPLPRRNPSFMDSPFRKLF